MLYWCVLTLGPIGVATSLTLGHQAFTALQASTAEVLPSSSTQPSSSAPSAADSAPRATAAASTQAGAAPPATDTATSAPAASAPHSSRRQKNSAGWALSLANIIFGFVVSWILILLMYRLIPDTRVRWRPAAIGSFLAALSWEIGKWGFGFYVATAAKNSAYGSLALLPLFMFWIYITWSVVLIGLEITYVQQYWPLLKRQYLFIRAARRGSAGSSLVGTGVGLSDLRWVLSLGILLYQRFKLGKPIHIDQAAEELMLPNDITAQLLISLERAGIVHPTATSSYTLARPPDTITAHDLLNAARAMCQAPPDLAKEAAHVPTYPKSKSMQRLEELESEWA
jgi:DNA-binding IscR family transcriptional regulator